MRDVLIVSPRFPPANAADAHRIRMSLPFYRAHGWNPIVLTADDPSHSDADNALLASIPDDVEIVRVPICKESTTRRFGFGQMDYRAFLPLLSAGAKLIRTRKIPVILISTTAFLSFALGPIWKKMYGCKIVYDLQDPWFLGNKLPYTKQNAPGSWNRYIITQRIARYLEPVCMRSADHIISVSPGYVDTLRCRYPALPASRFTVLPFPASGRDHDFMEQQKIVQTIFKKDGRKHWVYVGRGGPDMNYALGLLFAHLSKLKQQDPLLSSKLQLHFVGTSYAPTGRSKKTVEPLASSFGLDDIVHETSERIAYFEALAAYRDSDAVLLIGSESSDYTASKLFNCVLSGRPVFAIFHSNSLVTAVAANFPCVYITNFGSGEPDEAVVERLANQHLRMETEPFVACAAERLAPWLVEASTEAQCQIFDAVSSA